MVQFDEPQFRSYVEMREKGNESPRESSFGETDALRGRERLSEGGLPSSMDSPEPEESQQRMRTMENPSSFPLRPQW